TSISSLRGAFFATKQSRTIFVRSLIWIASSGYRPTRNDEIDVSDSTSNYVSCLGMDAMYVRKRKNESGSYSVMLCAGERLPGKNHPISRMVKSFGVAKDDKHLKELLDEAERYKKYMESASPKAKTLRINNDRDISSCHTYNVGFHDVYGNFFSSIF